MSQDSVHLVQYNLLSMGVLFQCTDYNNANMTLADVDLPQCTSWFCREPTYILK